MDSLEGLGLAPKNELEREEAMNPWGMVLLALVVTSVVMDFLRATGLWAA